MKLLNSALVLILGFLHISTSKCEQILFIYPIATKSETKLFLPFAKALAARGHQVTIVTPVNTTNLSSKIKQVVPTTPLLDVDFIGTGSNPLEQRAKARNQYQYLLEFDSQFLFDRCHQIFQNAEFQNVYSQNQKYDLIIMSGFFQNCLDGVLHKLQAPFIHMFSMPPVHWMIAVSTGYYFPTSFVPIPLLGSEDKMDFGERVGNTMMTWFFNLMTYYVINPEFEQIYRHYMGPEIPGIVEIERNVSMLFSHSHYSLTFPRPFLPDVVEVGGIHCHPGRKLPADLETFVAGAKDGVILFSLGSVIQAHTLPEETRKVFLNVFSRLRQRVLWKWETEIMNDLPSNVKLSKWLPQQDILGHTNTKLFISHGGLLSTMESAYHGTPVLGIPIFVDQIINMKNIKKAGNSLTVEIIGLTETELESTIRQMLDEPRFTARAKEMSSQFRDHLNSPMDRAIYWSEYVMRHKGAKHLRSASRQLNYWQYHSVDVILFLAAVMLTALFVIFWIMRKCWNVVCEKSKSKNILVKKYQ